MAKMNHTQTVKNGKGAAYKPSNYAATAAHEVTDHGRIAWGIIISLSVILFFVAAFATDITAAKAW